VYHVAEKGVEVVRSWSSNEPFVALVDGDRGVHDPEGVLISRTVQLIVPSSPKGVYNKWTKQTGHASSVTRRAIKLWSHKEFFLTGLVFALLSTLD
jgi:hypothetical protein